VNSLSVIFGPVDTKTAYAILVRRFLGGVLEPCFIHQESDIVFGEVPSLREGL
jgi:hypothetical protein